MLNLKVKNIESYVKYFASCSIRPENPAFYRISCIFLILVDSIIEIITEKG